MLRYLFPSLWDVVTFATAALAFALYVAWSWGAL